MTVLVPYETSGQELGETRQAMAKKVMVYLEEIINKCKHIEHKYYVLVHAKPFPNRPNLIKQKFIVLPRKPRM